MKTTSWTVALVLVCALNALALSGCNSLSTQPSNADDASTVGDFEFLSAMAEFYEQESLMANAQEQREQSQSLADRFSIIAITPSPDVAFDIRQSVVDPDKYAIKSVFQVLNAPSHAQSTNDVQSLKARIDELRSKLLELEKGTD